MSLNKIILQVLEKNPVALKESLSSILSEKIADAIDKRMNESANVLDKHIASFSKKIKSSASKPTRYRSDNKVIPGMKHVEVSTEHNHQDVFDALKSMGYYKTRGYDSKPNQFTTRHNAESMATSSDPVHHKDGISAHFEHEHGGKMKVHFKARDLKEETLEEGIKDGYYVDHSMKVIHNEPFKDSKSAIRNADSNENKTGKVHRVTKVKDGKVEKQWAYNGGHHEGGWEHYSDYKGDDARNHLVGFHKNSIKEDLDENTEIKGDHLISAKLIHKDLKNIDSLSPDAQKVLKRHERQMITKYGEDWRKKAGINEDVDQLDEVISKAERRNLAYHEKQAVRAAEKANVGALPRSDKEKWIDDYIAKNFIPKGAVGSAVYSGVMKVRPIKVEK